MPFGDRQPIELLNDRDAWERELVRLAEERGHVVIDDSTTHERYTCTTCGRAVIRVGCNIYGRAATEDCPGPDAKEAP